MDRDLTLGLTCGFLGLGGLANSIDLKNLLAVEIRAEVVLERREETTQSSLIPYDHEGIVINRKLEQKGRFNYY